MNEELSNAHLLLGAVCGLATVVSSLACLLFSWLRNDIRSLAEKIETNGIDVQGLRADFEKLEGKLQGKGLV
jgi:hypothetical protein